MLRVNGKILDSFMGWFPAKYFASARASGCAAELPFSSPHASSKCIPGGYPNPLKQIWGGCTGEESEMKFCCTNRTTILDTTHGFDHTIRSLSIKTVYL